MFYKQFLFILASLLLVPALINGAKVRANSCEEVIAGHGLELSVTDGLWAFMVELLQRQDLQRSHLERMLAELNENRLENIYSPQEIFTNTTKLIYSQTAAEYFANSQLDRAKLKFRIEQKINELTQNQNERALVREETASLYRKIKFNEVGVPGKFVMGGEQNTSFSTEITFNVAFTDTHITQNQWVEEMKINPSLFKGKEAIDGIIQQPDHPVEQITWYSAAWYANVLSKKYGLPETYDFKNFKAKPGTSAAEGTLVFDKVSGDVLICAPTIYEAPGIRLATEAELEWLAQAPVNDGKETQTQYPWGNDLNEINDYCWNKVNSNEQTHSVASRKAYRIRGQSFFDLAGNVGSWGNDKIDDVFDNYFEPLNPIGINYGNNRVVRGGSFKNEGLTLGSSVRFKMNHTSPHYGVGLRLARTCW